MTVIVDRRTQRAVIIAVALVISVVTTAEAEVLETTTEDMECVVEIETGAAAEASFAAILIKMIASDGICNTIIIYVYYYYLHYTSL